MLVAGAKGHVNGVVELLLAQSKSHESFFFDDISENCEPLLFGYAMISNSVNDMLRRIQLI